MKIHIESGFYNVRVATTRGDTWEGLFDLDHCPDLLEIVQALDLYGSMPLTEIEIREGVGPAYHREERKWARLRDVVEFASLPAASFLAECECEVWTPGKRTKLGTITITTPSVFRNPENSEPWGSHP
jgi:hypothetical protein